VSSSETLHWTDADDEVLGGDLTAALAYVTPAQGVVLAAVAPIGLRDRDRGTVTFTTSLGFGRKLDRIRANPRVALAYHAREHGFADGSRYLLVQGDATFDTSPSEEALEAIRPNVVRFLGEPKTGFFWDRWLREYYADRVLVTVRVRRLVGFDDLAASGAPLLLGLPLGDPPEPQAPPANGTGPRVDVAKAARRAQSLPHVLLGFVGPDGYPVVLPVRMLGSGPDGLHLKVPGDLLPAGGRRAGLLSHRFEAQLIGLESRQHTGWVVASSDASGAGDAVYAPHTAAGFKAPANKTVLLLANGLMAKRGLAKARKARTVA
jgi:hypothetical protein